MDSTSQCTLVLSFMIMCGSQGPPECSYFWFFDKIYLITSILLLMKEIFLSTLLHCYFYPQYRSTSSTSDALDTVIWVQLGSFSYLSECNKSPGVGGHWGIQKKKKSVNYIPKQTRWKQCGSVIDLSRWMLEKAFNSLCLNRINIYRWKDGHEGLMSFSSLLLPTSSPSGQILFSFSIQEVVHLVSLIQSLFGSWMASKDCTWNNCLNAPSLLCDVREVELFPTAYLKSFRQPWPPCRCPLARIHSHILKKTTHTWGSLHETLDPVWTCSVSLQQSAALLSLSPFCLQRKGKHTSVSDNVTVWSHLHET